MAIELPRTIEGYFSGTNARDVERVVALFAEHAVVRDERREHQGTAAIRGWIGSALQSYQHTLQVLDAREDGASTTVRARVSGKFPGSPIDLNHHFTLAGGRIERLEIRP